MSKPYAKISVVGLGYVGLPVAALLATRGLEVIGVDVNKAAVDTINEGGVHFFEPDLDIVVGAAVTSGKLRATTTPEPADAFVLAVPTPLDHATKRPDVSYVEAAAKAIAPVLERGNLVVLESTSPVGTTEKIAGWLAAARPDLSFPQKTGDASDIHLAHCPERMLPGNVLRELVESDRIIGGISPACAAAAAELYSVFVTGKVHVTDSRTAELAKLVENSYRDVNIAFANELSLICDQLDINVWELIGLANNHPRVKILKPGPGVGGHCIAVDPWFIVDSAPEQALLIRQARQVNDSKPYKVLERIEALASKFRRPTIVCLGLAYKPDTDDLRESPALQIVEDLARRNLGEMLVVEPYIKELPAALKGHAGVRLVDVDTGIGKADVIVMLVDHKPFAAIPQHKLRDKIIVDTRGLWR
jgi:UDP-N-acetyl-D-mannosaminuronic acid dehydrogenase